MKDDYFLSLQQRKRHFVCVHCRKLFEQPSVWEMAQQQQDEDLLFRVIFKSATEAEKQYIHLTYFQMVHHCPQCHRPMAQVGHNYKIPHKRAFLKWKRIKAFLRAKGYIHPEIPSGKRRFRKLLEFEIQCVERRLSNLPFFTLLSETPQQSQERLQKEIQSIRQEIKRL